MSRTPLAARRPNVTITTDFNGQPLTLTIGLTTDGQPAEVFADGFRYGSGQAAELSDACVVISIALQHGIPAASLARSLGTVPAWHHGELVDRPASVIGAVMAGILEVGE